MEEKKMEETPEKETKKLTYDELKDVASQLQQQNKKLIETIQQMDYANLFKRLDYLFKVVELRVSFKSEFVERCLEEVERLMTPPEPKDTTDSEDIGDTTSEK